MSYYKRATVFMALSRSRPALADLDRVIELKPDFSQVNLQHLCTKIAKEFFTRLFANTGTHSTWKPSNKNGSTRWSSHWIGKSFSKRAEKWRGHQTICAGKIFKKMIFKISLRLPIALLKNSNGYFFSFRFNPFRQVLKKFDSSFHTKTFSQP